jgi:uncharacterized damage-inducible protein DinB
LKTELETIGRWYEYNSYVRKRYLDAVFRKIPASVRCRETGASFPSVVQIFVHVLDAYRWWFTYVYGDRLSEYQSRRAKIRTRREVTEEERTVDSLVMDFVRRLDDRDLDRVLRYRSGHIVKTVRLGDMLHHMVDEELQHRGEINALFWQRDINPPVIGFHEWVRKLRLEGSAASQRMGRPSGRSERHVTSLGTRLASHEIRRQPRDITGGSSITCVT